MDECIRRARQISFFSPPLLSNNQCSAKSHVFQTCKLQILNMNKEITEIVHGVKNGACR